MIWELAPNEALGLKRIFSIIMEEGLGLPTSTIVFWGTHVPRILPDDNTFNAETLWHFAQLQYPRVGYPRVTIARVPPFIPRERSNVNNTLWPVIQGYHGLHQRLHWCESCIGTAAERRSQGTQLAIRPKIMATYEEAAASLGWLLYT